MGMPANAFSMLCDSGFPSNCICMFRKVPLPIDEDADEVDTPYDVDRNEFGGNVSAMPTFRATFNIIKNELKQNI